MSVNASKLKRDMNIEDKQFQQMVVDSGVSVGSTHLNRADYS
jgi:hypothetical protein